MSTIYRTAIGYLDRLDYVSMLSNELTYVDALECDAVPGRISSYVMRCYARGIMYGQCSEICGALHAYMPIAIAVVRTIDVYVTP